ncbi:D-hexose-6-phosphate mutarotase [Embleya hyalina]|uniref:Putative glucose-6-phosphate 1-epimerase n=1 Tax=Embleya hyalina TaxID=516124 RepID=A0A401YLR3_9ACTN|nr:D-hexose-6-phosphate mutarotase [Embleya hyalina]GCD95545.1 D-hexose-6-phosphate mutarotase [Embleya hyalina]
MPEDVFALPVDRRLGAHTTLRRVGALPVVVVTHPRVRAAVTLQGAQLLHWQPAGEEPVLWLSETTAFEEGRAVRGGVPICWPWFGAAGRPTHGFARILPWELLDVDESGVGDEAVSGDEAVRLTLVLRASEETRAYWPHEFEVFARFVLGRECRIELEAGGDFESTAALHTYLRVGDLDEVRVTGLGGPYVDKVLDTPVHAAPAAEGVAFRGRTDRVYTHPGDVSPVEDPAGKRVVEVRHEGHTDVVVWNPGADLARSMADVPDDGYREFVCVETAHVSRPLVSTPGAPARLAATLRTVPAA